MSSFLFILSHFPYYFETLTSEPGVRGTVILGAMLGALLALSSITSSAVPEEWTMETLYVHETIQINVKIKTAVNNKSFT